MKYIKTFENLTNNQFWLINGNIKQCEFIFNKFCEKYNFDSDDEFETLSTKMRGVYFRRRDNKKFVKRWEFWEIEDSEYDVENGKHYFIYEGLTFGGEIKYKNGEIIIDTLIPKIDKYNL